MTDRNTKTVTTKQPAGAYENMVDRGRLNEAVREQAASQYRRFADRADRAKESDVENSLHSYSL